MYDLECPFARPLSLAALARSNRKEKPIELVPGWLQELPEGFVTGIMLAPSVVVGRRFNLNHQLSFSLLVWRMALVANNKAPMKEDRKMLGREGV